MQFSSIYFILFFLPVSLIGYHLADRKSPRRARLFLLACSLFFCGLTDLWSLLILIAEALIGWSFSRIIFRTGTQTKKAGRAAAAGIALQILALVFFKYTGFLIGNIGVLFHEDFVWHSLILPLGISYTTFTQIAYLADCCRGRIKKPMDPASYALYLSFFPKLSQGPIATGTVLAEEIAGEKGGHVTADGLADGIILFVLGLSKKLLIADIFGRAVDMGLSQNPYLTATDIAIIALSYTFQIYFDFSGYSDMAIGLARMFGYTLPVNFDSPYRARSITDFWRRWHMSLTGFFREYVYFPLGGSRKGTVRTCVNIMIVFLLSGLWHGANWTFVLWGFFHGALQVIERLGGRVLDRIPGWIRGTVTFVLVSVLWLLFRCSSVAEFRGLLYLAADQLYPYINDDMLEIFRLPASRSVLQLMGLSVSDTLLETMSLFLWMALSFVICLQPRNNTSGRYRRNGWTLILTAALFVLCVLSTSRISTFIYTSF
ncbi:MAG: MBOAT family protein [Lachnospiraceae bacterium]|nr:MBOAT family protein [Lachnospiraceae bacterium]